MAKWEVGRGLTDYISQLGNLEFKTPAIIGKSVYEGAKIVADQIRANIQALPTDEKSGKGRRNPKPVEKEGMLAGLGIAKHQVDGSFYNVKIGMDGYNADKTKKYPGGKPNAMIARSINAGTTFMNRIPFITNAVNSTKGAAEAAMAAEVDRQISETMSQ